MIHVRHPTQFTISLLLRRFLGLFFIMGDITRIGSGLPYGMALYQSVLTPDLCSRVIDYFEATPKRNSQEQLNGSAITFEQIIMTDEKMQGEKLLGIVYRKLRAQIDEYLDEHIAYEPFLEKVKAGIYTLDPRMKKYNVGDGFPIHSDDSSVLALSRRFAYILYLNDNFRGGDTVFRSARCEVLRIRPEQGTLAVFPVHPIFMHEGEKVQEGAKYILNGFVSLLTSSARCISYSGVPPTKQELVEREITTLAAELMRGARKVFGRN